MELKKEFAKEFLEVLKISREGLVNGVSLVYEQAPEITNQVLKYSLFKYMVLGVGFLFISVLMGFFMIKLSESTRSEDVGGSVMTALFVLIASLIVMLVNVTYVIQVWLAPKVFIINYLADMLSG